MKKTTRPVEAIQVALMMILVSTPTSAQAFDFKTSVCKIVSLIKDYAEVVAFVGFIVAGVVYGWSWLEGKAEMTTPMRVAIACGIILGIVAIATSFFGTNTCGIN